jgi:WD40 repeat protein
MKKRYFLIFLTVLLGLHLSSLDILGQSCTQLSLPDNALARLCTPDLGNVEDLDFSPDGKTLASAVHQSGQIVLWDVENHTEKLTIDGVTNLSPRYTVQYSPDGETLVSGDVIYNAITGEPHLFLFDGEGYVDYVTYSPDGNLVAGAGPKGIRFWNIEPELSANTLEPSANTLPNILPTDAPAPANRADTELGVSPMATSAETVPKIRGISYSPDGKELAVACGLGVWIYDPEANKEIVLLTKAANGHDQAVAVVAYSHDGNTLASAATPHDHSIRLWDAKTKKYKLTLSRSIVSSGILYSPSALVFSPESDTLLIGTSGNRIHLYDAINGEYRYTLSAYMDGATVALSPDGNIIASYNPGDRTILLWDFTSYPIVSISPDSVPSLTDEELVFNIEISNGRDISGYQLTIDFDPDAFVYKETQYKGYLSEELPVQPIVNSHSGSVQLTVLSLSDNGGTSGDGILATITFKVSGIKSSKLVLRDVILTNSEGGPSYAWLEGAQIIKSAIDGTVKDTCPTFNPKDVNRDCIVNIQDLVFIASKLGNRNQEADVNGDGRVDIIDLVLVAGAFGDAAAAPAVYADTREMLSASNVQHWLSEAYKVNLTDSTFQRGMLMLEQLLIVLIPKDTALFPNYPNPFNPETWIPYHLAKPAEVVVFIYSANGTLIRTLALGYQTAGIYRSRDRAAYWDGTNEMGESVASGVYFYTFSAGEFKATRKMLVIK